MADKNELMQAKVTFDTLCKMLDQRGWKYRKNEDDFTIDCSAQGDDLPIDIIMEVDAERKLVLLLSQLPFIVPEDKRVETSLAVSAVNYTIVDGNFDYNFMNGKIIFRLTSSYLDSMISTSALEYMLLVSCGTIDEYNDQLLMFVKGRMSLEQIIEAANK